MGANELDAENNTIYSGVAVFGQFVWNNSVPLREIESTMQVRGDVSTYMVYQVVPNPSDLTNQFFIVGGNLQGTLSSTDWVIFRAGQDDLFHVAPYLGDLYALPPATPGNRMSLSDLSQEPILLSEDDSPSGLLWGDALVRWVSPQGGFGSGYDPVVTSDLDDLLVYQIPEPRLIGLLMGLLAGLLIWKKGRR